MKRLAFVMGVMAVLGLSGCATEEYVRSQTDPLAQRISKLEAAQAQQAAAIKQADDKAQQALNAANKVAADFQGAQEDVKKAEAAAMRAENAAQEAAKSADAAKQMAQKSEKIFKLEQKK